MFEHKIFSQVSSQFVSHLFPKGGEKVEIRIGFDPSLRVEEVFLITNKNGVNWRHSMERREGNLWSGICEALYRPAVLRYYFAFRINSRFYYYSKGNADVFAPAAKDHFVLLSDLDFPSWIASSSCYQIFPDRFSNGDKSNDVKAGEYEYDGALVSAPSFQDEPKPFEESRCLDFYNGDLKGIEDKISYLKDLGVTCLYLNPINSSLTVHRFDSTDYFSVDPKLGGDDALESLIDKCHKNGIRVVVDISINHTGSGHKWFKKAVEDASSPEAGYYYKKEDGSFVYWNGVSTLPQLNYNSQALRDIVYRGENSALKKYLRAPFFQDGWRLDVAPELGRCGSDELTHEVWKEVRASLKSVNKDIYLVGEDWNDASEYLQGDMWDATMNYYGSGRILRSWMGERDRFLCDGWGHSPQLDNAYNAYDAERAFISSQNSQYDQGVFFRMNLFDSHDTPRLHNDSAIYNQGIYEGVVMALYMLPGMPNIYYGDEIGLAGTMGSVEGSRYPMCWDSRKWNLKTKEVHSKLGMLRKYDKDLAFASTYFEAISSFCLSIIRKCEDHAYLLLLNKADDDCEYRISSVHLKEYSKADDIFDRSDIEGSCKELSVYLRAHESTIIKLS